MPTRVSPLAVQIEAIGVDKVRSALREVGGEAETQSRRLRLVGSDAGEAGYKYGFAAKEIAKFTDELAESGKVSGRNLRSLISVVSELGFAFGPQGALVSAIAIGGAAIYHLFERTRQEMEKTQKKFDDSIAAMINTGDAIGLEKQVRDLYRGTPANNFEDALKPKIDKLDELKKYKSALGEGKVWLSMGAKKAYDELMADGNVQRYFGLVQALLNPMNAPLPEIGLHTVTTKGKAQPSDESIEAALSRRIDILSKGLVFDDQRARITKELTQLEKQLKAAVDSGTLSLEARTTAALHLAEVEAQLARKFSSARPSSAADVVGVTGNGETPGGRAQDAYGGPMALVKPRGDDLIRQMQALMEAHVAPALAAARQVSTIIKQGIADTIGSAINDGFAAAFSGKGIGGILKAFGKSLLASLGNIFGQLGQVWIEYGIMMTALGQALWNPFTSGPAAIAIGAALIALSAALGATAHGGGGGAAPSFTARVAEVTQIKLVATSVADAARMEPRNSVNMTVIGPGDPVAFRQIKAGLDNNARR